jgi:hypothetical protein
MHSTIQKRKVAFRSTVPYASKVFDIVQYGSIIDLQKAIDEGKASSVPNNSIQFNSGPKLN